jgi:hypothetical protein
VIVDVPKRSLWGIVKKKERERKRKVTFHETHFKEYFCSKVLISVVCRVYLFGTPHSLPKPSK